MRVGISIEVLFERSPDGASVYTYELCQALGRSEHADQVGMFHAAHSELPCDVAELALERRAFHLGRDALFRAWSENRPPSPQFLWDDLSVVHTTGNAIPPVGSAHLVATVHDVASARYPEAYPRSQLARLRRSLKLVQQEAALVICPSRVVATDLNELVGVDAGRIRVIPHGVDSIFLGWDGSRPSPVAVDGPYLLWVGTKERRKNVECLIDTFDELSGVYPDLSLVLHAPGRWLGDEVRDELAARGLLGRAVVHDDLLTRPQMAALYGNASVFVLPSRYEGFGMPALEAMACGTPVVVSGETAMCEWAADVAQVVEPCAPAGIASAVAGILDDPVMAQRLGEAGRSRARQFSWESAATKTWQVYEEAAR